MPSDPFNPSPALLAKIGSALVHAEEFISGDGHHFDRTAFDALMADEELVEWQAEMHVRGRLPFKRA